MKLKKGDKITGKQTWTGNQIQLILFKEFTITKQYT